MVFRSFFLIAIISWYSTGIWRLIDDYFRKEFSTYLSAELKKNKLQPVGSEVDQTEQVKPRLPSSVLYANLFGATTVKSKKVDSLENHGSDGIRVNYAADGLKSDDDANVGQKLKQTGNRIKSAHPSGRLISPKTMQTERVDGKIASVNKAIDSAGGDDCNYNELHVFGTGSAIDNDATDLEQNDLINYWKARKSHQPQLNHRDNGFCELANSEC